MNEFMKVLLNVRSLRAALRDLSFEQLEEAREKFDAVYAERAESVEKERAEQEAHQRKLAEFSEMLLQAGIDPRELLNGQAEKSEASVKSKRAPREPKYKYDDNGVEKTWTGQGRTPKAIADAVAAGQSIDDFLIEKE